MDAGDELHDDQLVPVNRHRQPDKPNEVLPRSLTLKANAIVCSRLFELALLLALMVSARPSSIADPIQLRPARTLQASAAPLGTGTTYAIPCVTDWNGDGRNHPDASVRAYVTNALSYQAHW
jgi:hypothetical protein